VLAQPDRLKAYQKEMRKAISSVERELKKMEGQQDALKAKVLQAGKGGRTSELRQHVKDFLRTKRTVDKFYGMKSALMGVQVTMETTKATMALREGLKCAGTALRDMNASVNAAEMRAILDEFGQGVSEANLLQELMGEAIDNVMDPGEFWRRARRQHATLQPPLTCTRARPPPQPTKELRRTR